MNVQIDIKLPNTYREIMIYIPFDENPLYYMNKNNQQDFLTDTLQRQQKAQDLSIRLSWRCPR